MVYLCCSSACSKAETIGLIRALSVHCSTELLANIETPSTRSNLGEEVKDRSCGRIEIVH